jgi:O-succinylbenzoic acid--CoA ligase
MGGELSVVAAAAEAGERPALAVDGRTLSFAELAALVGERMRGLAGRPAGVPQPLAGTTDLDALITLYALLESRTPALLVHPRLTPHERAALEAAAGRAGPVPDDAAAIVFTSGTTGEPRAAVLTRRALVASAEASAANLGWHDDDRWLLAMPLAHVGGLSIVVRCLAARRCVVAMPKFDAPAVPGWIDARRVTLASMVPTMLARVLDANPQWRPQPHFRAVLVGGAGVPDALLGRARARGLPVLPSYGLTEACAQIVAVPYAARFDPAPYASGLPLPGAELRVADGRIEVRGPMLMAGYWGEPPLAPGAWFDTGDLGEIDARGCLHVHARRTDLVVTGGENVYPAEVERALEALPGIAEAGVFGVPSDEWGEEVAAALVARGAPPSDAALREHVAARLAPHKRPRRVCYVSALPHTAGGKLDRAALRELAPALRRLRT